MNEIKKEMIDLAINFLVENYLLDLILKETTVRITRKATFSRRAGAAVGSLAKKDPAYKKMQRLKSQWKKLKQQLNKKYASKAKALARKRAKTKRK